jgi:hypothetical protein
MQENSALERTRLWSWAALAAVVAGAAISLRLEGRLWICACGRFQIWSGNICSSDNSQHFLDPYSFTHLLHGFLFFWLIALLMKRFLKGLRPGWQIVLAVTIEALWEVFENTNFIIDRYRAETAALGYNGDTVVNSFGDIVCCLVGFLVARRLAWRRSIIVFLVVEVILILWIRDSLLLEVVMLISSIDAVKAWQLCP